MHFKPLGHLARVSFAKGVAHVYAPGAIVAGQQGIGNFQNYPVKHPKATQLQNAFSTASSSGTGAGAAGKAGPAVNSGDAGLAQYYAAYQHAQQTGDDTDLRKAKLSGRLLWKSQEKPNSLKHSARIDTLRPTDILRQPVRQPPGRAFSENAIRDPRQAGEDLDEAEALAQIDEAIANEIKDVRDAKAASTWEETHDVSEQSRRTEELESVSVGHSSSLEPEYSRSPSTVLTEPITDEAVLQSEEIIRLGGQNQLADIPSRFQFMVKNGLVPSVQAYNYILQSAISLRKEYQHYTRAIDIYKDMTKRGVPPDQDTYRLLITFLATQSIEASQAQKAVDQHLARYGRGKGSFIFPSIAYNQQLYADDLPLQFATKFYNIARLTVDGFSLLEAQFSVLADAYTQSESAQSVIALVTDVVGQNLQVTPESYASIINACASVKDLTTANQCYEQYRDLAIARNTSDSLDVKVYVALIKVYYACGAEEEGLRFFEKILRSFSGSADQEHLVQHLTDAFVVDGLVEHYVKTGNLHQALESVSAHSLTEPARAKAVSRILVAAADGDQKDVAITTMASSRSIQLNPDAFMAVAAMHFRAGDVPEAVTVWKDSQGPASLSFATMHTLSLMEAGQVESALACAREMFRTIRASSGDPFVLINHTLDEPIHVFGQSLSQAHVKYSSQAALQFFRLMIENGGLVPYIAEAAMARVGPGCIHELDKQDIALALHVQAQMLPGQTTTINDTAQAARFSHLLETVLDQKIPVDPSTMGAVDEAVSKIAGMRPDLEQRWTELRRSMQRVPMLPAPVKAVPEDSNNSHSFDPYGHTTDHRASKAIAEILESTTGRPENHLANAMARLKNVRRMGRHLQYSTYAKLIAAAGKAKQNGLLHEILAMAQTDVPFDAQISAVRNGWIAIYDSTIAACLALGDRELAAKYHASLLAMGAVPSANTFGIYITTLEGTFDEATEAVKIFQRAVSEGVTPSVFLFNAVIGKLGKARRIDDCLQYFGQMQSLGIRPSSVTYGTLVNALCRTSEETFAVDMFDEMEAAPNYRPRPAPYNSIIQYFLNTKRDRSKVLQYYGRMRSKNIKPTSHTYKLLIEAYATLEPVNLTAAETVLDDMKVNGVRPEAVHYGSLIHAKGCVMSDMQGARAIFDSVLADRGIKPTDNLYQNLLEAMVANHEVEKTEAVLADMAARGIAMTPYIANTLIHGWAGQGNMAKAQAIYNSLGTENREPSTYEQMARAFLSVEDHAGANEVVQEMLSKGYPSAVADKVLSLVGAAPS